jgi:hypothetical protein
MTPRTDPHDWPEQQRFDCVSDSGTKHTLIVRREPAQQIRTLDGVATAGGGHLAYFTAGGFHLNPIGEDPVEFTVAETQEVIRKV